MSEIVSGLCYIWEGRRRSFPLQSIKVNARLIDTNARVSISQNYSFDECYDIFDRSTNQSNDLSDCQTIKKGTIECVYVFPLDEYSAVDHFDCLIDDRRIEGVVKPKKAARAEYDQAVSQLIPSALLEQSQENVFEVRIGAINRSNNVTINLSYLTTLTRNGPTHQFVLPMIVAPKYTPYQPCHQPIDQSTDNVIHSGTMCVTCHQSPIIGVRYQCTQCVDQTWCEDCENRELHDPSHSRMKIKSDQSTDQPNDPSNKQSIVRSHKPVPPHIAAREAHHQTVNQTAKRINMLPNAFVFDCDVEMASSILSIECPSHPNMVITRSQSNNLSLDQPNNQANNQTNIARASLILTDSCSLQRDLVLSVNQSKPFEPRCMVEYDPKLDCASVSLSFDIQSINQATKQSKFVSEYVFLLDRSGSMQGESIEALKQSMQLLIKSLPLGSKFQILGFGSSFHCLFDENGHQSTLENIPGRMWGHHPVNQSNNQSMGRLVDYNDETCAIASNYLANIAANMGGTEIAAPLRLALSSGRSNSQSNNESMDQVPRNVFIVTDGQVSNIGELVSMVAQTRSHTRVFTLGIGSAVDRSLVRKLARAGFGECEFVSLLHNNQTNDQSSKQKSDMRSKVLRQLGRAMQPILTDVRVDWGTLAKRSSESKNQAQQCPRQPPAVFPGSRFNTYLLDCQLPASVMAKLKAHPNQSNNTSIIQSIEPFEFDVLVTARSNQSNNQSDLTPVSMTAKVGSRNLVIGSLVDCLAARARIAELEQMHAETPFNQSFNQPNDHPNDRPKLSETDQEIEALGLRFGLASRATSFIVVFDGNNEQIVQTDASEEISQSNVHHFHGARMLGGGGPSFMMARAMPQPMPCPPPMMQMAAAPMANTMAMSFGAAPVAFAPTSAPLVQAQSALLKSAGADPSDHVAFFGCFDSNMDRSAESINRSTLPTNANDVFDELVLMQSGSGCWKLDEKLIDVLKVVKQSIDQSKFTYTALHSFAQSINQSDEVVGTMLVLHVLKSIFADRSDDWQFMAGKAQAYVDQRCDQTGKQSITNMINELVL